MKVPGWVRKMSGWDSQTSTKGETRVSWLCMVPDRIRIPYVSTGSIRSRNKRTLNRRLYLQGFNILRLINTYTGFMNKEVGSLVVSNKSKPPLDTGWRKPVTGYIYNSKRNTRYWVSSNPLCQGHSMNLWKLKEVTDSFSMGKKF